MPNWEIPEGLELIVPYEKFEKKEKINPLFTIKEFLRVINNQECGKIFVEISYKELNENILNKIKYAKNAILILKATTENVFAYPGIGMMIIKAINETDYPVVQGTLMVTTFTYVLIYLIVDIINAFIDPRVEYET